MALVETKDSRVVRDTETRALLSTNIDDLQRSRRLRDSRKRTVAQQQTVTDTFALINNRLDRCESLLQELAQHISMLVAKYPSSERE